MTCTMAALVVGHGREATPSFRLAIVQVIAFLQLGCGPFVRNEPGVMRICRLSSYWTIGRAASSRLRLVPIAGKILRASSLNRPQRRRT
jgi:hypothetical protein